MWLIPEAMEPFCPATTFMWCVTPSGTIMSSDFINVPCDPEWHHHVRRLHSCDAWPRVAPSCPATTFMWLVTPSGTIMSGDYIHVMSDPEWHHHARRLHSCAVWPRVAPSCPATTFMWWMTPSGTSRTFLWPASVYCCLQRTKNWKYGDVPGEECINNFYYIPSELSLLM